jgi:hypothetical protein
MSGEEHAFLPLARNVSSVVIVSGDVVLRWIRRTIKRPVRVR